MVVAKLEKNHNTAVLYLKSHFGKNFEYQFAKNDDEIFRLSGTAINEVLTFEGVLLNIESGLFRAFSNQAFEGNGVLSPESWDNSDKHCYVIEYYDLEMEGKKHGWLISKYPLKDSNYLFINVDILDGGQNIIKRYRISPFFGTSREINDLN